MTKVSKYRWIALAAAAFLAAQGAACSDDGAGDGSDAGGDGGDVSFPDVGVEDDADGGGGGDIGTIDAGVVTTCPDEDAFSPNHTASEAAVVGAEGLDEDDLFVCPGYDDYFSITLEPGQGFEARIDFAHRLGDLDLWLYEAGNIDPEAAVASSGTEEDTESLRFEATEAGTYVLHVDGFEDAGGLYDLVVRPICRTDADCPCGPGSDCTPAQYCSLRSRSCETLLEGVCGQDAFEPNDRQTDATTLSFRGDNVFLSAAGCGEDRDFYRVDLDEISDLTVEIAFSPTADLDLAVVDADAAVVGSAADGSGGETLLLPRLAAGTYFVYVDTTAGGASEVSYTLDVTRADAEACTSDADCSSAPARSMCGPNGGCVGFTPETPSPIGGLCDNTADCDESAEFCYLAGAGLEDNVCSRLCFQDADCADLSDGQCVLLGRQGLCLPACDADTDCPAPYACAEGTCEYFPCAVDTDCGGEGQVCLRDDQGEGFCRAAAPQLCAGEEDDGNGSQSAATELDLDEGGELTDLVICDDDDDWYRFELADEPASARVTVRFDQAVDIDVYLIDASGGVVGAGTTPDGNPEVAEAEYLAAGTYYIWVNQFPGEGGDVLTSYELSVETDDSSSCSPEGNECNLMSPPRSSCLESGACTFLAGAGSVEPGGYCDSSDDCEGGDDTFCYLFGRAEPGQNICTRACSGEDDDCADVPGTTCLTFGRFGLCAPE